jgi:hypothetical protein
MTKTCFISTGRPCDNTCMAYRGTDTEQECALLHVAHGITSFFIGVAKAQGAAVKHPASPPAPEVK